MKKYRMFRSADGGIMLQHPDNPDAIADGNNLLDALNIMRDIENDKGLQHLVDQVVGSKMVEFIE